MRIKKALARKGLNLSENKISRIIKEHGLVAIKEWAGQERLQSQRKNST
ncbi:MAG: hypothetical protein J6J03_09300, partial [Tyzzerella sp.]|nr:hypothetical protein [Tyzzerella sp.]